MRIFLLFLLILCSNLNIHAYYTTQGKNIVDRETGEIVILTGFGLGGWLLPEGYMWGIRSLDRPWQFEKAIEELIGKEDAQEFWRIYHDNYVTREDVAAMKSWGINTIRVPLLASKLQPRENQPNKAPYNYSEEGFRFLDSIVNWCAENRIGVIWDLHGAPGGQNAENISDSDGEARLWTEKEKYWPMTNELWLKIAERYKNEACIVGYDLLNEPLLIRYDGIDSTLLRELYVELTNTIRKVDKEGIIFIEGDDWAQNFSILEPMDWDSHLAIAFHTYPPSSNQKDIQQWDDLSNKYNLPLWHGETGEQGPPYDINKTATTFCGKSNIGWSWWTHKKFGRETQPWVIYSTDGFEKILNFWRGHGERPLREDAKKYLFEQALYTNTKYCKFLPEMVNSLIPLEVDNYLNTLETTKIGILNQSKDIETEIGKAILLEINAFGNPIHYNWYKNGELIPEIHTNQLRLKDELVENSVSEYVVAVTNEICNIKSEPIKVKVGSFTGIAVEKALPSENSNEKWADAQEIMVNYHVIGKPENDSDLSASFKILYDTCNLYLRIDIKDNILKDNNKLDYMNDGVEIYLDPQNKKPVTYEDTQYLFRYIWNKNDLLVIKGSPTDELFASQTITDTGYIMDFTFPWKSIGGYCENCEYIGVDIHINDNDIDRRKTKIVWHSKQDNASTNPMAFGVMKLKN